MTHLLARVRTIFDRQLRRGLAILAMVITCGLVAGWPARADWRPSLAERRFDIQLSVPFDLNRPADIVALDLFTTAPERIAALHAHGVATLCYVAAGRWENWRPDAGALPGAVLGGSPAGWPGERWLDIRNPAARPFLEQRLDLCRARGFDGVLLADLDGYAHAPGFAVDRTDQLAFNLWLAGAAHRRGLAAGIVDDLGQAGELAGAFDFLVATECLAAGDCGAVGAFLHRAKPVFLVAYTNVTRRMDLLCAQAAELGAPLIFKTETKNGKLHRRCS